MKTNLKEIVSYYKEKLTTGVFEETDSKVFLNTKKIKNGTATITINIKTKDDTKLRCSMFVVEKKNLTVILFVNDNTGDIVFNSVHENGVERSKKYIDLYLERSVSRMLGIPVEEKEETAVEKDAE